MAHNDYTKAGILPDEMMISRFGAESQTARYTGHVAMIRPSPTRSRRIVGPRYFGPSRHAITPG